MNVEDLDGFDDVPGWILDHGDVWHASINYDGRVHGCVCEDFTDWRTWQADRPQASETYEVCLDCLDAIEDALQEGRA